MCNLYRVAKSVDEVAGLFRARPDRGANFGEEIYPGYPGLVVADGRVRSMNRGFPRPMTSKRTGLPIKPKAVNNAREDKLLTRFWRNSFENRRCLIPVTAWAEAEGEQRRMTRTWHALPGTDVFAVAGIWRRSDEWGEVYSMVMVDGCAQMADIHDRMPAMLLPADYDGWLHGTPDQALALARTLDLELRIDRTEEPWGERRASTTSGLLT